MWQGEEGQVAVVAQGLILAVDDEASMLRYYREFFRLSGKEILTAASVGEAIRSIENHEIELVVLDLEMPGRNGSELLDWLCENRPKIWVLVVSAFVTTEVSQKVAAKLNGRILTKPCSIQDVCDEALKMVG